jgi:hypothetical protein
MFPSAAFERQKLLTEIDAVLPGNIRDFHVTADPIQPMTWSAHRRDGWRRGRLRNGIERVRQRVKLTNPWGANRARTNLGRLRRRRSPFKDGLLGSALVLTACSQAINYTYYVDGPYRCLWGCLEGKSKINRMVCLDQSGNTYRCADAHSRPPWPVDTSAREENHPTGNVGAGGGAFVVGLRLHHLLASNRSLNDCAVDLTHRVASRDALAAHLGLPKRVCSMRQKIVS